MAKTGKSFDMNPDTFTLENLFAMELHNFKDVIGDIVTSASKELSIEKVTCYKLSQNIKNLGSCFIEIGVCLAAIITCTHYLCHIRKLQKRCALLLLLTKM